MPDFLTLPTTPFVWGVWDCFALADWLRSQYNVRPLPSEMRDVTNQFSEQDFPPDYAAEALPRYCVRREGTPQHLDLLCLRFRNRACLGTVVEEWVVYFGEVQAQETGLERLGWAIESVWVY